MGLEGFIPFHSEKSFAFFKMADVGSLWAGVHFADP